MKPTILVVATLAVSQFAHAAEDCGCNGTPASTTPASVAPATTVPATPLVLAPAPEAKLLLRLKLPAGGKYRQKMVMDQRTTSIVDKRKITMNTKFTIGITLDVLAVSPEGNMTLRYTFDEYKMTLVGNPTGVEINKKTSAQVEAATQKMTERMSAAFRGHSLTSTLTPEGKAVSISGVKELMDAVLKAAPSGSPADQQKFQTMMQSMTRNIADKDRGLLKISGPLPPKAISLGESWTTSKTVSALMLDMKTDTRYTLDAWTNGIARVGVKTTMITLPPKGLKAKADGMNFNISGATRGTMEFDEETGLTLHSDLSTTSLSKIAMPAPKSGAAVNVTSYGLSHMTLETNPAS